MNKRGHNIGHRDTNIALTLKKTSQNHSERPTKMSHESTPNVGADAPSLVSPERGGVFDESATTIEFFDDPQATLVNEGEEASDDEDPLQQQTELLQLLLEAQGKADPEIISLLTKMVLGQQQYAPQLINSLKQLVEVKKHQQIKTPAKFALAPALAQTGPLDYESKAGSAIFKAATAQLLSTFSLKAPNVALLLEQMNVRASSCGWSNVLTVVTMIKGIPTKVSLLDKHNMIGEDTCVTHAQGYMHTSSRSAQNDYQIFVCLTQSVDAYTTSIMAKETARYIITAGAGDPQPLPSGICYLKVLLLKAEVNSRAFAAHTRNQLSQLDKYIIKDAKYDIGQFNDHVRDLLQQLSSRGETSTDAMFHVFRAYEECKDEPFLRYIERIKHSYEDGGELTIQTLMTNAEGQYKTRVLYGNWNQQSPEQKKMVAMQAHISSQATTISALTAATAAITTTSEPSAATTSGGGDDQRRGRRKPLPKRPDGRPAFEGADAWRLKPPGQDDPTTKNVNGKTLHFCERHGYWCFHTSEVCKLTTTYQSATTHNKAPAQPTVGMMANIGITDCLVQDEQ